MHSVTILNIAGLALTFIGAWIAASAVMLKEDDAIALGVARYAGSSREENLKLPFVQALLQQSRRAQNGLYLVAMGTGLQMGAALSQIVL